MRLPRPQAYTATADFSYHHQYHSAPTHSVAHSVSYKPNNDIRLLCAQLGVRGDSAMPNAELRTSITTVERVAKSDPQLFCRAWTVLRFHMNSVVREALLALYKPHTPDMEEVVMAARGEATQQEAELQRSKLDMWRWLVPSAADPNSAATPKLAVIRYLIRRIYEPVVAAINAAQPRPPWLSRQEWQGDDLVLIKTGSGSAEYPYWLHEMDAGGLLPSTHGLVKVVKRILKGINVD